MIVAAVVLSLPSFVQLDFTTPKKTALTFCKSIESLRWKDAAKCVINGSEANAKQLIDGFPKGGSLKLDLVDMTSETQAETASVVGTLKYVLTAPDQPKQQMEFLERLELRRQGDKWMIVASQTKGEASSSPLAGIAWILANGAGRTAETATTPTSRTLSNLKQLSVAALIYATDYDDLLPMANWQKSLLPYVKNNDVFRSPMSTAAKPSIYRFNAFLIGKNISKVAQPARTVMFYEGSNQKLNYLYEGKGAVAFCDSKSRLVAKQEAATLIWKP